MLGEPNVRRLSSKRDAEIRQPLSDSRFFATVTGGDDVTWMTHGSNLLQGLNGASIGIGFGKGIGLASRCPLGVYL
jgi:hypothetical protein